jgi:hypothetical protein
MMFVVLFERNDTEKFVYYDDYEFWIVKDLEGSDNGIFLEGLKKALEAVLCYESPMYETEMGTSVL